MPVAPARRPRQRDSVHGKEAETENTVSLSALQDDIAGIGQKMLLQHLGELQVFGMVQKISLRDTL